MLSKLSVQTTVIYRDVFYRAAGAVFIWASVCLSLCLSNACIVTKRKHLAKKSSIMTNRKSPTSFPMSLRWTAYVAPNPPKGASKTTLFFVSVQKTRLSSKKVCHKISLCENFQRQSCKAFIGLSIRAQMLGGGCPLVSEILDLRDPPPSKTALSSLYSLVAPQA